MTNLTCYFNCPEEIVLPSRVYYLLGGVVPIEVHDTLLKTEQVVHSTIDDVDGSCVTCLGPQIVLPV